MLRYEQEADDGPWRRRVNVVAGVGGFGPVTDALIEAAGRSVFQQVVPASYEVKQAAASPARVCQQMNDGCFAWIYLGHGLPTELDTVDTPDGERPILSVDDVPRLRCGPNSPLAVLIACYTGAIDARADCLAEELAVDEQGPVAVIAATRVTMPYGNTVLGCELLRAGFTDRAATLGELWTLAQRRTLAASRPDDSLRASLDALARGVSPPPVELAAERREHVLMYHLLGDPLLRLEYAPRTAGKNRHVGRRSGAEVAAVKTQSPGHDASTCPGLCFIVAARRGGPVVRSLGSDYGFRFGWRRRKSPASDTNPIIDRDNVLASGICENV